MSGDGRSLNTPLIESSTSSNDPFYAFRDELKARASRTNARFENWRSLLNSSNTATNSSFSDENAVLKKELSGLLSNVNDLDQVVQRIASNRANFAHITDDELQSRENFVLGMKQEVDKMKTAMSSQRTTQKIEQDARDERKRREKERSNDMGGHNSYHDDYVRGQLQEQEMIRQDQDKHLGDLEESAVRLNLVATEIGDEIEHQSM